MIVPSHRPLQCCRCGDDHAEFYFSNGAVVHYFFSHIGKNKSVEDALGHHGDVTFEFYDVVVANSGNAPHLSASRVLDAALKMQAGRTTFFWFSSYDGAGDIKKWTHSNQAVFHQSGAKFVAMGDMARGLDHLTVGAVENRRDPHFCLPGPPNEIGLLLVKMIWAIHQENEMQ